MDYNQETRDASFYSEQANSEEGRNRRISHRINKAILHTSFLAGLGLGYVLGSYTDVGDKSREIKSARLIDSKMFQSLTREEFVKTSYERGMKELNEGSDVETIILNGEGQVLTERAQRNLPILGLANPGSSVDFHGKRPVTREMILRRARTLSRDATLNTFEVHLGYIKEVLESYK